MEDTIEEHVDGRHQTFKPSHQVLALSMKEFSSPNYRGYCGRDSKRGDPKIEDQEDLLTKS
jgi:hypothetical protein